MKITVYFLYVLIYFSILGSDCYNLFKTMQSCMQRYPSLYNKDLGDDEDLTSMDKMDSSNEGKNDTQVQESKISQ